MATNRVPKDLYNDPFERYWRKARSAIQEWSEEDQKEIKSIAYCAWFGGRSYQRKLAAGLINPLALKHKSRKSLKKKE